MPRPEVLEIYQGQDSVGHDLLAADAEGLSPHEKRRYMELVHAYESIATPKVLHKVGLRGQRQRRAMEQRTSARF